MLARIVGKSCSIDLLIGGVREELRGQPYDLIAVAGGWKHQPAPAASTIPKLCVQLGKFSLHRRRSAGASL